MGWFFGWFSGEVREPLEKDVGLMYILYTPNNRNYQEQVHDFQLGHGTTLLIPSIAAHWHQVFGVRRFSALRESTSWRWVNLD